MTTLHKQELNQELVAFCFARPNLAKALRLWDRDSKDWRGMYAILEFVVDEVGGPPEVSKRGWATGKQINHFKHTANTAGDESRHGTTKAAPPVNPMPLVEARALVRRILLAWIEHEYGRPLSGFGVGQRSTHGPSQCTEADVRTDHDQLRDD